MGKMAKLLEWDKFKLIYGKNFSNTIGAKGVEARVVKEAMIIKNIEAKDNRGIIEMITENPYMQFFLGFDHFSSDTIFDTSLFVTTRKRLRNNSFDKMNEILIRKVLNLSKLKSVQTTDSQSKYELSKLENQNQRIEKNERNQIEGKFGQGKSKYNSKK